MTLALHFAPGDVTAVIVTLAPGLTNAGRLEILMLSDTTAAVFSTVGSGVAGSFVAGSSVAGCSVGVAVGASSGRAVVSSVTLAAEVGVAVAVAVAVAVTVLVGEFVIARVARGLAVAVVDSLPGPTHAIDPRPIAATKRRSAAGRVQPKTRRAHSMSMGPPSANRST